MYITLAVVELNAIFPFDLTSKFVKFCFLSDILFMFQMC